MFFFKYFSFISLTYCFVSCVSDEDQKLPDYSPLVYSENFQSIVDSVFITSEWSNIATKGTTYWVAKTYYDNAYYEFSPYGSNEEINEAWLISPEINIDKANSKILVFDSAQHHVKDTTYNNLKVYILTDFDKENPENFTKKELKCNLPEEGSANNYQFTNSGRIDLSDFSGNIQIGFKSVGGDESGKSGAYQIDNIKVF